MKEIIVVAAAIIKSNQLLITKRANGQFKGLWELPGGKVEPNESFNDALKREIDEELSLNIRVNQFITTINHQYPNFKLIMHVFVCEIINGEISLLDHSEYRWINQNQLKYVNWLPADIKLIPSLRNIFQNKPNLYFN